MAVVWGSYRPERVARMLESARHEVAAPGSTIGEERAVPGAMEQPLALKRLPTEDDADTVVVFGIVENGETNHGLVMARAVIRLLIDVKLAITKPVGMGSLDSDIHPRPSRSIRYVRCIRFVAFSRYSAVQVSGT
ncbi:6,7-dimethyl-8-ribityllumazine synthase [Burkholderia contaminans]|nr:6,7-dimethyl-8-ribityllumazine synthase [Burkholderia contaminans]